MAVIPHEQFLLRRARLSQRDAADSLDKLSGSLRSFSQTVAEACDTARQVIESALDRTAVDCQRAEQRNAQARAALDGADLAQMEAQRDALIAEMRKICERCGGGSAPCTCWLKDH